MTVAAPQVIAAAPIVETVAAPQMVQTVAAPQMMQTVAAPQTYAAPQMTVPRVVHNQVSAAAYAR